jgi:tRNA uridine 5-carboxymethylaminomethyl modification enzyme
VADEFDCIVVGAGHAGCEAALACSRLQARTLLLTINLDHVAFMSCNPAIGGIGKGHLVKEIDALGGEMGRAADEAAIQFRILNTRKGVAVRGTRVQTDKRLYAARMSRAVQRQQNLFVRQATVERLLVRGGRVYGVETDLGEKFYGRCVILTTGTFLNGLIHIGLTHMEGGRTGDPSSKGLSSCLADLGFEMGRLKTGTCPRLDGRTIDFSRLERQDSDPPKPFSFMTKEMRNVLVPCYVTYTNERTHEIIRSGLDRSPLFTGKIKGKGVRYCPSIEDKVVRFSERPSHRVFLEPEGLDTTEYYPNGLSTSLPLDIQLSMVRSLEGLESARITRPGYGIEYDFVYPTQLLPSLETKLVEGLFLAGQINGTTGYEEAAAQGLLAGINAALKIRGDGPFILGRDEAYIGVLIDDLVTRGVDEPYRMFTSRAELRLLLREDNADLRLTEKAYRIGLAERERYDKVVEKRRRIEEIMALLRSVEVRPSKEVRRQFELLGLDPPRTPSTLFELLKRTDVYMEHLKVLDERLSNVEEGIADEVEIEVKYEDYVRRQREIAERLREQEERRIPEGLDFSQIPSLSREVVEKLQKIRPLSFGQASRIPGITPSALFALMVYLKKRRYLE